MTLTGTSGKAPYTAAARVFSWWVRRRVFPGVAVFCYHGIRPDALPDGAMAFEQLHVRTTRFEQQIRALARACTPISLNDWRRHLRDGTPLPERAVHITFDDGYRSVLSEALPILEHYEVPATVFLATGPIARQERFWYDALARQSGEDAVNALKTRAYDVWSAHLADVPRTLTGDDDPHAPLTSAEVTRLAVHPLIEIGGHTHDHPILAQADLTAQGSEIAQCASSILEWTGRPMRAFAYPNGRGGIDFTEETSGLVEQAGVDHAFTSDPGFAPLDGNPLTHPRFLITAGVSAGHLLHRLARVWR